MQRRLWTSRKSVHWKVTVRKIPCHPQEILKVSLNLKILKAMSLPTWYNKSNNGLRKHLCHENKLQICWLYPVVTLNCRTYSRWADEFFCHVWEPAVITNRFSTATYSSMIVPSFAKADQLYNKILPSQYLRLKFLHNHFYIRGHSQSHKKAVCLHRSCKNMNRNIAPKRWAF